MVNDSETFENVVLQKENVGNHQSRALRGLSRKKNLLKSMTRNVKLACNKQFRPFCSPPPSPPLFFCFLFFLPHNQGFQQPLERQISKSQWEKEMLVTISLFLISQNVFFYAF